MTGIKLTLGLSSIGWLLANAQVTPGLSLERLATDAPAYAILAWLICKTIPQISRDHREGLESVAQEVRNNGESHRKLLERALDLDDCDIPN